MSRAQITSAKRIVIKIGSSSLTGKAGSALDADAVNKLVDVVAACKARGSEVVVVSSGAIAAGLAPLGLTIRPKDLATQQAAASVGQGLLIAQYTQSFNRHSITASQVLLTTEDVVRRSHYQNAQRTLYRLLQLGVVPIINENDTVGTGEIRFGDNDRLAALVALLISADLLVLVSDIDALYDAPPTQAGANRIHEVASVADIENETLGGAGSSGVGSGGMVTKVEAARIATSAGIPMLLTSLEDADKTLAGQDFGTHFHAHANKTTSRLLWLAHATKPRAITAPSGPTNSMASPAMNSPSTAVTPAGSKDTPRSKIAFTAPASKTNLPCGLVAFDSEDLPKMLGRSTKELAAEMGVEYERELVHRDDLVLL